MSEETTDPLRVCLLLDGNTISDWEWAAVERMLEETNAELSLVLRNRADRSRSMVETIERAIELREWTIVTLLRKLVGRTDYSGERVDLVDRGYVAERQCIDCVPEPVDGWKNAIPEEVVAAVAGEADVGILFGFGVLVGDILDAFEYGILSYHHGDFRKYRGQPAGCWEFIHGEREVGITLQRINETLDAGEIVVEKTVPIHDVASYAEIRRRLYANSEDMLATAVSRIEAGTVEFETVDELGPLYRIPKGMDAWRFLLREIRGAV